MAGDRLIDILTDIRDQQKRQVENFETAVRAQEEYLELQRKSKKFIQFLVYAPWIALLFVFARSFIT